jgi:hypothetical protein
MLRGMSSLQDFDRLSRTDFVVFLESPQLASATGVAARTFSLMPRPTARLDRWHARHPEVYRRVVVSAVLEREFRDELDQANINERVLHGGLDGLCQWLARCFQPPTIQGEDT